MLGLVFSLVVSAAPALPATTPALPAAETLAACGDGPTSCDLGPVARHERPRPEDYATPAVIDCRSPILPVAPFVLAGLVECEGPHDASYRVSRFPESENSASLSPGARQEPRGVASCDGLPQKAPSLAPSDAQPLALFATPAVVHVAPATPQDREVWKIPSRFGDPPDRPPRV
jgi:hypothetical protein